MLTPHIFELPPKNPTQAVKPPCVFLRVMFTRLRTKYTPIHWPQQGGRCGPPHSSQTTQRGVGTGTTHRATPQQNNAAPCPLNSRSTRKGRHTIHIRSWLQGRYGGPPEHRTINPRGAGHSPTQNTYWGAHLCTQTRMQTSVVCAHTRTRFKKTQSQHFPY